MANRIPVSRRKSRQIALSLLYSTEFVSDCDIEKRALETISLIDKRKTHDEYALYLFKGVRKNLETIDKKIKGCSHNWRVERMSLIDKNIIRIAVFELMEKEIPTEVIINEAVEVAKFFGDSKSPSFVNGILDTLAKIIRKDEK